MKKIDVVVDESVPLLFRTVNDNKQNMGQRLVINNSAVVKLKVFIFKENAK
jgi:hypothetical protein